ncbi:MAG: V-type ATP synthase subunit K [Candidatus Aenigmarchaeota archaeon]|nr:V-type ATP synthase subunit K [Candidatus Aenigmarchaeota archaeon]
MAGEEMLFGVIGGSVLGIIGAALAIIIAGISSAKGLEIAGNTAAAATGENEENFSSSLILQAMPQTQTIYGFIVAILIILGIMNGGLTMEQGFISFFAGLVVGITGISALMQGKLASSSIGAAAKNSAVKGKVLIFVVMPEIAALFGFVIGVMMLIAGQVF